MPRPGRRAPARLSAAQRGGSPLLASPASLSPTARPEPRLSTITYSPVLDRAPSRALHLGLFTTPGASLAQAQQALDQRVLAAADLRPGLDLLDVGCGLGSTLVEAAPRGLQRTGLNRDPAQLDRARALPGGEGITWVCGEATHLPFPAASFDRVLCVEAAFHFSSRAAFYAEAARVLRPGGRLVTTDILPTPALVDHADAAIEARVQAGAGPWVDFFGRSALFPGANFVLVEEEDLSRATLASWTHFLGGAPDLRRGSGEPIADACHVLGDLHQHGALQVWLRAWVRRA